jgi:hypothetical protein
MDNRASSMASAPGSLTQVTQMQDGAALAVCRPRIAILAPSSSGNSTTAAARMPGAGRWRTPTGAQGKSS